MKKIFSTVKAVIFTEVISEIWLILGNLFLAIWIGQTSLWIWISQNLLIISEIWLIQITKKRLLYIRQISLIISVKIDWFDGEIFFFTDESVKINWFNGEKCFWLMNQWKESHWFNQWKFYWFRFREFIGNQ